MYKPIDNVDLLAERMLNNPKIYIFPTLVTSIRVFTHWFLCTTTSQLLKKLKLKKTSMQRKWILITLVLNSYPYYWKSFVMPPDMQAQSKDVLFFRKIQSSVGKSVRLFIGAQNYRDFPQWQDIFHKAACNRKTIIS